MTYKKYDINVKKRIRLTDSIVFTTKPINEYEITSDLVKKLSSELKKEKRIKSFVLFESDKKIKEVM